MLLAKTLLQIWPDLNPHGQLLLLDDDLNELGPVLEERFKQEDRLVKALHVVESLTTQQA